MRNSDLRIRGLLLAAMMALAVPTACEARPPEIRNINVRGLQIGGTTVLTIDGAELSPSPRLFLGEQALEATIDSASTATRLIVSVPIAESVPPGIQALRLFTAEGFSNSQWVGLDRFPQTPITEKIGALPVSLHGSVPGSGVSRTSFPGKAGDEVIVEVEARRLGSKLRPVIHVYDSHRIQIAWTPPSNTLAGDARLMVKLPRDDQYTIEIHDTQYAPPGPAYFRMKVGQWQFADLAFPPAITQGQDASVDLIGNVAGVKVPLRINELTLAPVALPNSATSAGLPPSVLSSSLPELIEVEGDQSMPLPAIPVAVSGRLSASGQRDRYLLPVQPGMKLLLELFAERIGSQIDAVLEIRNKQNAVVATNDDGPMSIDPRLEYTVPADQDSLEVSLRDNLDRGGDASIYRLVVTKLDLPLPQFDVTIKSDAMNVPAGESQVLEAFVNRQAYDGPIQLQVAGLPPGTTVTGTEIPAGANGTLMVFSSAAAATVPLVTRISAQLPDGTLTRPVHVETTVDDRSPTWMREQVAIASVPPATAPFQITPVNEASLPQLVLASKPAVALKLVRPPSMYGPVRLSLVTSQPIPRINGQPNLPQSVRAEKPVEVPVDNAVKTAGDALAAIVKQHAEAVQQAQAAQADTKPAADAKVAELAEKKIAAETALREAESKAVYQLDYALFVPSNLAESSCDIAIRAELLNPEKNTVLRTAYTPVRRLAVLNPLNIKLTTTSPLETTLDPKSGTTFKLTAVIERLAGYSGDVTVAVTGLTAGVTAANATVKAEQTEFAIEFKIPPNYAAAEVTGIKLTATGPADAQTGNIPVKSVEIPVTLKVNKPAP
ncbi:MAG: hypothetical protein JSS49_07630 [Planctomycetes bacterium]|nr:hypothetical protein [Planctomycetota bacterium]